MPNMAKHKFRRSRSMTIPIAVVVPIAASFIAESYYLKQGNWEGYIDAVMKKYAGVGLYGQVNTDAMIKNYTAIGTGFLMHFLASKFGLNRALGRAKVPIIRI